MYVWLRCKAPVCLTLEEKSLGAQVLPSPDDDFFLTTFRTPYILNPTHACRVI